MRLMFYLAALGLACAADHPDLSGTWQSASTGETLSIHEKGDSIEIAESGKESEQIQCTTNGRACKIKGGEVTMWYNGPVLVVMQTHGSRAIRKKLTEAADGKTLDLEIFRIQPPGSTEKVSFSRQSGS